jgi:hypothetical protein
MSAFASLLRRPRLLLTLGRERDDLAREMGIQAETRKQPAKRSVRWQSWRSAHMP